jgi:hypothetical protein
MYAKLVIFAAISLSLVTVGYGSSISEVCAISDESVVGCEWQNTERTKVKCCYFTEVAGPDDIYRVMCVECSQSDGEWSCTDPAPLKGAPEVLPENLKDALDVVIEESQNTTKAPKTGVLDEPDALSDEESTENGDDDTEVPKGLGGLNEDDDDDAPTINPGLP